MLVALEDPTPTISYSADRYTILPCGSDFLSVSIILPTTYSGKTKKYLLATLRSKAKELQLHLRDVKVSYQQYLTFKVEVPGGL